MLKTKTRQEIENLKVREEANHIVLSNLMDYLNLQYRSGKKRSYIARIPGRK